MNRGTKNIQENALLVARFHSALNKHDLDRLTAYLAERVVLHDWAREKPIKGIEAARERFDALFAAFPDFKLKLNNIVTTSEWVICEWTATGTHRGPWMGQEPSHHAIAVPGVSLYRIINKRIFEVKWCWDRLGLLSQIGAVETRESKRLAA